MHLLGHIERKIRAHACRWAMLPLMDPVPSAECTDEQTAAWSEQMYAKDLKDEKHPLTGEAS